MDANTRLRQLSPPLPDGDGRALVFVKGYLEDPCHYDAWCAAFRRVGWRGSIHAFEWYSGGRLGPHAVGASAGTAIATRSLLWGLGSLLPGFGPALATSAAMRWLGRAGHAAAIMASIGASLNAHWKFYGRRADEQGRRLGAILLEQGASLAPGGLRLAGYSLGARLIHGALEVVGERPVVEAVDLYAGAIPVDRDWPGLARGLAGGLRNFHSANDDVLRKLFSLAEGTVPVGLAPIPHGTADGAGQIENVDVTATIWGHSAYPAQIDGAPFALD